MLREAPPHRLRVEVSAATDQDDVFEFLRAVEPGENEIERLVGDLVDGGVELLQVMVNLIEPQDLPRPQCPVDCIQIPEVLLHPGADGVSDMAEDVGDTPGDGVAHVRNNPHATRDQPVEGPRTHVHHQRLVLGQANARVLLRTPVERALGLRHDECPLDDDPLLAAGVEGPGHRLLQSRALARVLRHRQPDHEEVDGLDLHEVQCTGRKRPVLGRLGVPVVQLTRTEPVRGELDIRPDLVEQAVHRHLDSTAPAAHRLDRNLVLSEVGQRSEVGTVDLALR